MVARSIVASAVTQNSDAPQIILQWEEQQQNQAGPTRSEKAAA